MYIKFDGKEGKTELRWRGGGVKKISDGTWLRPGACTQKVNANEAVEIFWDPVMEYNMPVGYGRSSCDHFTMPVAGFTLAPSESMLTPKTPTWREHQEAWLSFTHFQN